VTFKSNTKRALMGNLIDISASSKFIKRVRAFNVNWLNCNLN